MRNHSSCSIFSLKSNQHDRINTYQSESVNQYADNCRLSQHGHLLGGVGKAHAFALFIRHGKASVPLILCCGSGNNMGWGVTKVFFSEAYAKRLLISQIAKSLASTSIKHRPYAKFPDWYLIDVDPRALTIWDIFLITVKANVTYFAYSRKNGRFLKNRILHVHI